MKTTFALAALLIAGALPTVLADDVTVSFALSLGNHLVPSHVNCSLSVPAGANGGDVLDAAVASGCISNWEFATFGSERFVTCIDGICQQAGTFWAFYVDEVLPDNGNTGIDRYSVVGGEAVEFAYTDWFTPFPPFSL